MDNLRKKTSLGINEFGDIEVGIKRSSLEAMRDFAKKDSPDMLAIEGQELLQRHLKLYEAIWASMPIDAMDRKQLMAEIENLREQFKFCVQMYNVCFIAWSLENIEGPRRHATRLASKAAKAKNKIDPKQRAKIDAKKLWQDWQNGKTLHKGAAAFARYVCKQYPVIENPTTVERWARKWATERA